MFRLLFAMLICLGACSPNNNNEMITGPNQKITLSGAGAPNERFFALDLIIPALTTVEIPFLSGRLTSFGLFQIAVTSEWPEEIILFGDSGDQSINVRVKKVFALDTQQWRNPLYLKNDYSAPVKVSIKIQGSGGH